MRFGGTWLALGVALVAANAGAAPKSLGFNAHQSTGVGLDATRDSGTTWVRIDVNWFDVEKAQGQYDWTVIDAVVDGAKSRGLAVLAVLAYTPAWASQGDTKGGGTLNDIPTAGTYASFVTNAVGHLKNRVAHYEIWNEPNLGGFFEGTAQDYVARILLPGANAVHAACPACKVVAPGLASVGGAYDVWMDATLASCAAQIDIVSGHVYAGFSQDSQGAGTTSDSFLNKLESHRIIKFGNVTVYEGPLSYKEVMDKYKVQKPFWLTETGKEATLGDQAAEGMQLTYYRRTLEAMLVRPWWEATIFYEAFDEPPAPYKWGVVVHDANAPKGYQAKAALGFLQKATGQQPAFGGTGTDCSDGLDNDNDGKIDYPSDPECKSAGTASEGPYVAPDAGPPFADAGSPPDEDASVGDDAGSGPSGANGGGCACAIGSAGDNTKLALFGLLAVLWLAWRRRRARAEVPQLFGAGGAGGCEKS